MQSILAITSQIPWPLDTGGHLRTFHMLRSLAEKFHVRLVAPVEVGSEEKVEALRGRGIHVSPAMVPPRAAWREAIRAVVAAANREPYVFYRRHDRQASRAAIRREIETKRPDLVYLDHLDSVLYAKNLPGLPTVLDLHNIYSSLIERVAGEQPFPSMVYLRNEARLLRRIERRAATSVDVVTTVSDEDRRALSLLSGRTALVIPNGIDCPAYAGMPAGRIHSDPTILYVGTLSWGPNVAAARSLATEIFPPIRAAIPSARAWIVGKDPSAEVLALADLPGVEVFGSVPQVLPFFEAASVMAVPLESGGGTRLKILEAFAAGLPVVSTPVGCEGLKVSDGVDILIRERGEIADAVTSLLRHPEEGARLAANARTLARDRYDWDKVGDLACSAVELALGSRMCGTASVRSRHG